MANSYEYIQIVSDQDWGLVGIVAPGSSGDRVKQMSSIPNVSEVIKPNISEMPQVIKLPEIEPSSVNTQKPEPISIDQNSPQRTIVKSALNTKMDNPRQKAKILTRHEISPVTPAEDTLLNNQQTLMATTQPIDNMLGLTARSRVNNLLIGFGK